MQCPVCKEEMIVVEHEKIELDYCPGCDGIWFDAAELELLFDAFGLGESFDFDALAHAPDHHAVGSEKARKCPICARRMEKVIIGAAPGVLVDRCPRGHGLWFDGGELGRVIEEVLDMPGAEGKVVSFLGQTFRAQDRNEPRATEG